MIHHYRLAQSKERDYDSEAECNFGSRHSNYEKDEEVAIHRSIVTGKRDERQNHPVEHEL